MEDNKNGPALGSLIKLVPGHLIRWGPATVIVSALVFYVLGNVFWPELLGSIGLPVWEDLTEQARLLVVAYGALFVTVAVYHLQSGIRGLDATKRVAVLITLVIVLPLVAYWVLHQLTPPNRLIASRLLLIVVFTALPASFYYLFIKSKRESLWSELKNNLLVLDPDAEKNGQLDIFESKFEALYGRSKAGSLNPGSAATLTRETPFPVFFLTLVVGLGWLLFFDATDGGVRFDEGVVSPFTFGFLGAYFFSVQMLFRRYVQSDLKPRAYAHASQRIVITWVFALVLPIFAPSASESSAGPAENPTVAPAVVGTEQTEQDDAPALAQDRATNANERLAAIAFLIGVFPAIAFQIMGQVGSKALGVALESFQQTHPLHEIDGITIWVEARLLEEDIENVQNLVSTNIADLMLNSNLQPRRIIDWIDQGVLLLHRSGGQADELKEAIENRGITTATDLIYNYEQGFLDGLDANLKSLFAGMVVSMKNDPNMYHVEAWRDRYKMQSGHATAAPGP